MIFELIVLGKIKSGNANGRGPNIYNIRKQIDSQMQRVWGLIPLKDTKSATWSPEGAAMLQLGSTEFLPLVCEQLRLACRLEVNFYEPEGALSVAGDVTDIDNRLKTLFDALKVPSKDELGKFDYGHRFHCLLSDDKLIWEVNVKRTRLLREIDGESMLTRIRVEVVASQATMFTASLVGVVVH